MNLLSWLLFGMVLGIITLASSSQRNVFTVIAVGINSMLFGVVLAHTIVSKGLLGVNLLPFFIAIGSILAFISLQRVLRMI